MKFNLAFKASTFFVGRNENGEFIKTDDSELIKEFDSFEAAEESPAHEFFKHDTLTVMPVEGSEFSACLGEDENSCVLGCGCVMYRSASYTDREVSITFCPLHEHAEKVRDVLGRLHDKVSDLIEETDFLDGMRQSDPAGYKALVDLLVNESLPLFSEGERGKATVVPAADSVALAALRRVLPYVPGYAEKDTAGRPWLANALAVVSEAPPVVESAADMIQRVFAKVNQETETWRGPDYIGSDLAYLAWAIAEGPGKGAVEWDEYNAAFIRFREWFPESDPVWQFIKRA